MNLAPLIEKALHHQDLTSSEMETLLMGLEGEVVSPLQTAALLVALRAKEESVEEITAAARHLDRKALKIEVGVEPLIDTCGTGGDGAATFNISTAVAFVVAAAGGYVAKHGGRSVSSRSGSADVLELAGVRLDLAREEAARCLEEVGIAFLFAPNFHPAFQKIAPVRRELKIRTLFNLLGPLLNPANAPYRLMGVFAKSYVDKIARVLGELGCRRALVVHAEDGLDELSLASETFIAEWRQGEVRRYFITPEMVGLKRQPLDAIRADSPEESLALLREALSGREGAARDIVALNAGAALYTCELAPSLEAGVAKACEVIASGQALAKLNRLIEWTQNLG